MSDDLELPRPPGGPPHASAALPSPYWSEARSHLAELVPPTARRVLDVGCNDGSFGAEVMRRVDGREVWGIEPHDLDARTAAGRLTPRGHRLLSRGAGPGAGRVRLRELQPRARAHG